MCNPASFVLTENEVYWSRNTDSHDEIITEHNLRESLGDPRNVQILRVEIAPKDGDLSSDPAGWVYHVDQDLVPTWHNAERDEARARRVLTDWHKARVCLSGSIVLRQSESTWLFGNSRAVCFGNSRAVCFGNSRAECWENSRAECYGNSSAVCFGNSRAECWENSSAECWHNSHAECWENSRAVCYGNSRAECYDNSRSECYENSRSVCRGNSTVTTHGKNDVELHDNAIEINRSGATPKCYCSPKARKTK